MRLLLSMACLLSLPAFATNPSAPSSHKVLHNTPKESAPLPPTPGLLSYRQLIRLSPARRMAYIHGFRNLLVELSRMQNGGLVADTSFDYTDDSATGEKLIAFLQLIDEVLFPQAEAAASMNCSTDYPVAFGGICGRYMTGSSCGPGEQIQGSGSRWFCFSKSDYNQFNPPGQSKRTLRPYQPIPETGSAEQLNAAAVQQVRNQQESTRRQQAEAQDIANTNQQVAIETADNRLRAQHQDAQNTNHQLAIESADNRLRAEHQDIQNTNQQVADERLRNQSQDMADTGREIQHEADQKKFEQQTQGALAKSIEKQEAGYEKAGKDEEAMRSAQKQDDALATAAATDKAIDGNRRLCALARLSCKQNELKSRTYKNAKQSALQKFRQGAPKICVSSGNMSGYKDGVAKAGGCQKVADFCLDPSECGRTEKGKTRAAKDTSGVGKVASDDDDLKGFKKKYSCGAGKSICNPLVFGLKSKSDAICITPRGSSLTEDCDKEATRLEKKGGGYVKDFLSEAPRGVAEAWDDYADDFNQTCKQNSDSMDAHCEECAKIASRLADEKALATGTCDTAIDYRRVPTGSSSATQ